MTDNKLADLVSEIDTTLVNLALKYNLSGLSTCSVVLARLVLMCDTIGSGSDLRQIMQESCELEEFADVDHWIH